MTTQQELISDGLREQFASLAHEQWSSWMEYLFVKGTMNADGTWTMPREFVERWQRQMTTPYSDLSEVEQNSARMEADRFLALLRLPDYPLLDFDTELTPEDSAHIEDLIALHGEDPIPPPLPEPPVDDEDTKPIPTGGGVYR